MHEYISKIRCGLLIEVDAYVIRLNSVIMLKCYLLRATATCGGGFLRSWLPLALYSHCPGEPAIYLETAARSVVLGLIYCW